MFGGGGADRRGQPQGVLSFVEASPNPQVLQTLRLLLTPREYEVPEDLRDVAPRIAQEFSKPSNLALQIISSVFGDNVLALSTPVADDQDIVAMTIVAKQLAIEVARHVIDQEADKIEKEIRTSELTEEKAREIGKKIYRNVYKLAYDLAYAANTLLQLTVANLVSLNANADMNRPRLAELIVTGRETVKR